MTDVTLSSILGGGGGSQRRETYVLTSSNASFPIPTWAQGGKGIVYVTGCGGGGSGSTTTAVADTGGGGGSAGHLLNYPVPIPAGDTTVSVTIGAGGAAATSIGAIPGNAGGDTEVATSAVRLRATGGGGAVAGTGGGTAGGVVVISSGGVPHLASLPTNDRVTPGAAGGSGTTTTQAGRGGASLFGSPGSGTDDVNITAPVNGSNATGFGAGGSGATTYGSGGSVTSGAGSPGLLILEFVEGL